MSTRVVGLWPWGIAVAVAAAVWASPWGPPPPIAAPEEEALRQRAEALLAEPGPGLLLVANSRLWGVLFLDASWWRGCGVVVDQAASWKRRAPPPGAAWAFGQDLRALGAEQLVVQADMLFGVPPQTVEDGDLRVAIARQDSWSPSSPGFAETRVALGRIAADGTAVTILVPPMRADLPRPPGWPAVRARLEADGHRVLDDAPPTDPARYTDLVHPDERGQEALRRWLCAELARP